MRCYLKYSLRKLYYSTHYKIRVSIVKNPGPIKCFCQIFSYRNELIDVKVKFSGEDRLEARTVLKDINGDETAELEIEMTREVRMTGKKGIESMLYSLVAAGLTFIINYIVAFS